ncbi:glycine-rich domain-containing protein [Corynebacterium ulcerans]|uniref:glycine-rich domain-containing protein n=1 Tax=Corynebacterium ulcerans TaxID=65058 RepID=UPI0034A40D09
MIFVGGTAIKSIAVGAVQVREVYRGGVVVWRSFHEPEVHEFRRPGHYVISSPSWAKFMDFVVIAGGGGGACGDNSWGRSGNGGGAGEVKYATLPLSGKVQLAVTVGAGGVGGLSWDDRNGRAGGDSSINGGGINRTAVGGRGGSGFGGAAAGARQYVNVDGFYVPAGSPAGVDAPGMTPGDGGGGGTGGLLGKFNPGQSGADGLAWIRFRRG